MIRIQFSDGSTLTINEGKVTAETKRLTKVFDYMARHLPHYGAPEAWDHDLYVATELVKKVGGAIVHHDKVPPPPKDITL